MLHFDMGDSDSASDSPSPPPRRRRQRKSPPPKPFLLGKDAKEVVDGEAPHLPYLRNLKSVIEHADDSEISLMKDQIWVNFRKLMKDMDKRSEGQRSEPDTTTSNRAQPLQIRMISRRIMHFITDWKTLKICRLVCKDWNYAASERLKKVVPLAFKPKPSYPEFLEFCTNYKEGHALYPSEKLRIVLTHWSGLDSDKLKIGKLGLACQVQTLSSVHNNILDAIRPIGQPSLPCTFKSRGSLKEFRVIGTSEVSQISFGNNALFTKLIEASPSLEKLIVDIKVNPIEDEDMFDEMDFDEEWFNWQPFLTVINQLQHLTLFAWKMKTRFFEFTVDMTPLLSAAFKLKSLELTNIFSRELYNFLVAQSSSLETLSILPGTVNTLEDLQLPMMKNLKSLAVAFDEGQDFLRISKATHFPSLDSIRLTRANCRPIEPSQHKTFLTGAEDNLKSGVKSLQLDGKLCDCSRHAGKQDCEIYVLDMLNTLRLEELAISSRNELVLRNMWTSSTRKTLRKLSLHFQKKKDAGCEDKVNHFYLDYIMTGYSVGDCKIINKDINQHVFFDLSKFKLSRWAKICQDRGSDSNIRLFKNLQHLEIHNSPETPITKVSFLYFLLSLNKLTSLTVKFALIRKYFVEVMQKSLSLGFNMDVHALED